MKGFDRISERMRMKGFVFDLEIDLTAHSIKNYSCTSQLSSVIHSEPEVILVKQLKVLVPEPKHMHIL